MRLSVWARAFGMALVHTYSVTVISTNGIIQMWNINIEYSKCRFMFCAVIFWILSHIQPWNRWLYSVSILTACHCSTAQWMSLVSFVLWPLTQMFEYFNSIYVARVLGHVSEYVPRNWLLTEVFYVSITNYLTKPFSIAGSSHYNIARYRRLASTAAPFQCIVDQRPLV